VRSNNFEVLLGDHKARKPGSGLMRHFLNWGSTKSGAASEVEIGEPLQNPPRPRSIWTIPDSVLDAIYYLALAVAISIWFIAIRAPLWLDETYSYWQISTGFSGIWPRRLESLCFPAYSYILWLSTKIIGSSEMALRIPSILAMLVAMYLLYLAARELFERDIAIIAAIIFCLHPIVIFESIDVRPYAFAVLATNASILILLRLRSSSSTWLAALFGLTAAWIVWFHYLFAAILPALMLCFFLAKICDRKALWRQFGVAVAAFALTSLPVIPGLLFLFHTARTYVYESAPNLTDLVWTLAPGWLLLTFAMIALITAAKTRPNQQVHFEGWQILFCTSLALIPVLILYGVSAWTPIHCFALRHRLDAIPGIALCWAMLLSLFRSRAVRLLFCIVLVASTAYSYYSSPYSKQHGSTWKYALEYAEKNASADNAPVVLCSSFVETNPLTRPLDMEKDSIYFASLTYYRLSVPVVPLPMALNDEAIKAGTRFLQEATLKHERFLALSEIRSYKTLDWLTSSAAATHTVRTLGVFGGIKVLEFVPRTGLTPKSD